MSSPLGLGFNSEGFTRGKAKYRYDKVSRKWGSSNSNQYEESLFNDGSSLSYFPSSSDESNGYNVEREVNSTNRTPHGDSIYDIRTQSIIEWSSRQSISMNLFARDFAYLRFLGVYPNNRLIVCRKFGSPVNNDLSRFQVKPVSTLVTWQPPGTDFFKISFGEEWTDADASFTEILNDIGDEFKMGSGGGSFNVGEKLAGGLGAIPLPGFSEIFQRKIMYELGLVDETGRDIIPSGNANLIKEAKMRKTIKDGSSGSGLNCKISIPVKIEYEQKFIGGLDPTKAFYDILSNISQFGTQDAVFYLNGAGPAADKFKKFITALKNNPREAITNLLNGVINSLKGMVDDIISALGLGDKPAEDDSKKEETSIDFKGAINKVLDTILLLVVGIVKKYEIRILGVVNALTGQPSGPWHVTVGNPKRPVFTSGDMICKEVNVSLGETLAFNDLPSRITVEFTLENARPLGLGEIMSRFMQGQGRSYVSGPSSWIESEGSKDFFKNGQSPNGPNTTPPNGVTQSNSQTPIGGNSTDSGSQVDASENIGSTQSNQTFSTGEGQESNIDKEPNPDDVRNTGTVTDTTAPAPNDVKPDATTSTNPAPPDAKVDNSNKPISNPSSSKNSNDDLVNRRKKIDDELANTPETITNKGTNADGTTYEYETLNPKRQSLEEEKRKIKNELEDREEDGLYKK